MSRKRLSGLLLVIALLSTLLVGISQPQATAIVPGWPKSTGTVTPAPMYTHPDGGLSIVNCSPNSQTSFAIKTWDESGQVATDLPVQTTVKRWGSACGMGMEQVTSDNTLLVPYYDYSNGYTNFYVAVKAVKDDTVAWSYEPSQLCSGKSPSINDIAATKSMVYLTLVTDCPTSTPYTHELVGLDPDDGAEVFRISLGNYAQPPNYSSTLSAYDGGVVVKLGGYGPYTFKYFDASGQEDVAARYTPTLGSNEYARTPLLVSPDGTVTIPVTQSSSNGGCSEGYDVLKRIIRHTLNGTTQSHDISSECFAAESPDIRLLPDGRAVALRSSNSNGNYDDPTHPLLIIGATGATSYVEAQKPFDSNYVAYRPHSFVVDGNGNITLVRNFKQTSGEQDTYLLAEVFGSDGDLLSRDTTLEYQTNSHQDTLSLNTSAVATANGVLYIGAGNQIFAFDFPEIGLDYPRNVLLDLDPPVVEELDYVALGDSFSSGEGVEPFYEGTNVSPDDNSDPDQQNMCHRSKKAYAKLLDIDPELRLKLTEFVACSGATTSNIINTTQWNENVPQHTALSGADVVTISIGGNDVSFEPTLTRCAIDVSGEDCDDALNASEAQVIALSVLLRNALEKIEEEIGQQTQVYVVGYPHILLPGGAQCPGLAYAFSNAELSRIYDLTDTLNDVISTETLAMGSQFHFVDPTLEFSGHEVCSLEPYLNGFTPGSNQVYSFHPNEKGQRAYAKAISSSMAE